MPEKVSTENRLSVKKLVEKLRHRKKEAYHFPSVEEIVNFTVANAEQGDQILIMSNGAFDNIHQVLINKLQNAKCDSEIWDLKSKII